jgi:hypothetical protein
MFRPQPALHAHASFIGTHLAASPPALEHDAAPRFRVILFRFVRPRGLHAVERAPPVASLFLQTVRTRPARPSAKTAPLLAPAPSFGSFASSRSFPPPGARSRRLQRASLSVPHFPRGQTSRPRRLQTKRNDIAFAACHPSPRACHRSARGPALQLTQRRQRLRKRVSLSRGAAQLSASRGGQRGTPPHCAAGPCSLTNPR